MAKDYAKRTKKNDSTARSGERRHQKSKKKEPALAFNMLSLLKAGFFLSLVVMSTLYLSKEFGENLHHWVYPGHSKEDLQAEAEKQQAKFEFYSLLKEGVSQPVKMKEVSPSEPIKKAEPIEEKSHYLLQVASFRQSSDADRLKAELTLKGYDVVISPFVNENRTWYRVKIGPFKTLSSVKEARTTLSPLGLNGMIQRVG